MYSNDAEVGRSTSWRWLRRFDTYTERWLTSQVPGPLSGQSALAVTEAWAWLENHGMVVQGLCQSGSFREVSH
jgi:hypothetical protein